MMRAAAQDVQASAPRTTHSKGPSTPSACTATASMLEMLCRVRILHGRLDVHTHRC